MSHPLALSPELREKLIQRGVLTLLPKAPLSSNPKKHGNARPKSDPLQTQEELDAKRAQNPPLCSWSGCHAVSKLNPTHLHFKSLKRYGKNCEFHAQVAADRVRAYKVERSKRA